MKALTLRQPWAYAVTHLGKRVENRPTRPPEKLVGERIALHAGKQIDEPYELRAVASMEARGLFRVPEFIPPRGAIVATVRIVGWAEECGRFHFVDDEEGDAIVERFEFVTLSDWYMGPIGILLDDVRVLRESVPCRGMQGYWPVPADVEARVLAMEGESR